MKLKIIQNFHSVHSILSTTVCAPDIDINPTSIKFIANL